jgi:hypothetical protein
LLVDSIYNDIATDAQSEHPLAILVPDRTLTELMAWPLGGLPPRQLQVDGRERFRLAALVICNRNDLGRHAHTVPMRRRLLSGIPREDGVAV